jgi:hypothetical protein
MPTTRLAGTRTSSRINDDVEREAIRAEGHDPDDPAVVTAIDLIRWELSMHVGDQDTGDEPAQYRG